MDTGQFQNRDTVSLFFSFDTVSKKILVTDNIGTTGMSLFGKEFSQWEIPTERDVDKS